MSEILLERWRQDRLPLLLYLVAYFVMTYPFVLHMHDSLPIHNTDTFKALWQNWWLREAMISGQDINHAPILFYPDGLDVTLDPRRWTTFPLWTALYSIFGDPFAFNLVSSFGILFKAYGMYLFGMMLFRERIPAWVTGAFYAFAAPMLVLALRQPNTGGTEWIPWFMLFFVYGLKPRYQRLKYREGLGVMILSGICFSFNLYMNLKIGIFAMLLGAGYVAWSLIVHKSWAHRRFWATLAVFTITAITVSAPLLLSVLRSEVYDFAIERNIDMTSTASIDLQNFIKADHEWPLTARQSIASLSGAQLEIDCLCRGISHVGVVAIVFALMGTVYILRFQRRESIWIILAVFSFLLSLGVVFHINGQYLDLYWTPYRILKDNFFFRLLLAPFRLVIVFMFPFSILIGYGLYCRLRTIKLKSRELALLVLSITALLYGTSIFPIAMNGSPRPGFLSVLNTLPEGAVIDVPMERAFSKYYMALQRFHGRPMAEGMIPRTPPSAYDYISENPILMRLAAMGRKHSFEPISQEEWRTAVDALLRDGFRYVIVHGRIQQMSTRTDKLREEFEEIFITSTPIHKDHDARIYDLKTWKGPFTLEDYGTRKAPPDRESLNLFVGDNYKFHAWSLEGSHQVKPCQWVTVESWWEATEIEPVRHSLTLIISEKDGDGQLAIGEKAPADLYTDEWQPGVPYYDKAGVFLPCSLPSGKYLLLLGMKETLYGNSLRFSAADGSPLNTLYYLTTIHVEAS